MKLGDLLRFIDSSITLETMGVKEKYESKLALTQERMNCMVKSIITEEDSLLIILDEPKNANTLDKFEYCFESGM